MQQYRFKIWLALTLAVFTYLIITLHSGNITQSGTEGYRGERGRAGGRREMYGVKEPK
jgi:hypothetical protein